MQQGANSATIPAIKEAKSESWKSVSILVVFYDCGGDCAF